MIEAFSIGHKEIRKTIHEGVIRSENTDMHVEEDNFLQKINWTNPQHVSNIIHSNLQCHSFSFPCSVTILKSESQSSQIAQSSIQSKLEEIILESFMTIVKDANGFDNVFLNGFRSNVAIHKVSGPTFENTEIFKNSLAMDILIPPHVLQKTKTQMHTGKSQGYIVAFYTCSLEFPNLVTETGMNIEVQTEANISEDTYEYESIESCFLNAFAEYIHRSNVTCVACQRRIHPILNHILLEKYGIFCIPHISSRYLESFTKLTGCLPIDMLPVHRISSKDGSTIDYACIGVLSSISIRHIHRKSYMVVTSFDTNVDAGNFFRKTFPQCSELYTEDVMKRIQPYVSIVATAPFHGAVDDIYAAMEESFDLLWRKMRSPFLLSGNGAWQSMIAMRIYNSLDSIIASRGLQSSISFSHKHSFKLKIALSIIPIALQECALSLVFGHDRLHVGNMIDIASSLSIPKCSTREHFSAISNETTEKNKLVECAESQLLAVNLAFDLVVKLLKVDGEID